MNDHHHDTNKEELSLWQRRTKLEKRLCISHIIFIIIFIGICICIALWIGTETFGKSGNDQTCQKPQCIHAASRILNSIDRSIDPCDNFYAFSCNKMYQHSADNSAHDVITIINQRNELIVKNVLEQPEQSFESKAEKKAKYYYNSCMDKNKTLEKLGAQPLINLLREIGGWDITDSNYSLSNWTLDRTLQIVKNKYNMGGLFHWLVGEDERNSSRFIIQIDQGEFSLPTRDYYLNKTDEHEQTYAAYLDYMIKVVVLLGANEAHAKLQMEAILEFETRLANITVPAINRINFELLYNNMTIKELQNLAPFINWREFFANAFGTIKREITENEVIIVKDTNYLENLTTFIKEYNETNNGKIILNNYLIWRTIQQLTDYLSQPFRDAYIEVKKSLTGSSNNKKDWHVCVAETDKVIGFATGAMFVRQMFNNRTKTESKQMVNEIRLAFQKNLPNLKWMDGETRKLADELLDEKYKELQIDPKKYFENNIQAIFYNLKQNFVKLDQPVDRKNWDLTPPTVNAYYSPNKNQIVIPAGILQLPVYDYNNPKSLKFGSIGTIMGHELMHGFDNQGSNFDKYGNVHQWWNNKTIEKFNQQTNCLIQQYSKYSINNKNVNGKITLSENIADNGGLKAAYNAFINSKNETEADTLPLPGLNMTHRQLFFVSFAQTWCSSGTTEMINLQIERDTHSPSQFRVIGSLSNLPEFSEEFNCPKGSKMNPINKCEVWSFIFA